MVLLPPIDLRGKVAIVTGGSRGIGRECCLALARAGCSVAVVAKTIAPHPTLPGTIGTVAKEVEAEGAWALPIQCDLRDVDAITACVESVYAAWGRIDILVNNASALWWQDITDTPISKYDLITGINSRGTFAITQACLPHMEEHGFGRVINMSPPIKTHPSAFSGMTAYNIAKYGMTMTALGVAAEYAEENITGNTLWPATVIESLASINFELGERKTWRKATILADCVLGLIAEDEDFTGHMLIDDEFLRYKGYTDEDFLQYRCDPDFEPPRLLAEADDEAEIAEVAASRAFIKRGEVRDLAKDKQAQGEDPFKAKL